MASTVVDKRVVEKSSRRESSRDESSREESHREENHREEDITIKVISTESNWYKRGIKESIEIRKRNPTLNADLGRFHLSDIWTNVFKNQSKLEDNAAQSARNSNEAEEEIHC